MIINRVFDLLFLSFSSGEIRDSIVVSIPACHAGDPGSIPGRGVFLIFN